MAAKRKVAVGSTRSRAKGAPAADQGGDKFFITTVRLTPEQGGAVRREAMRRALERNSARPDASEVLREIVEAWMAKGARP